MAKLDGVGYFAAEHSRLLGATKIVVKVARDDDDKRYFFYQQTRKHRRSRVGCRKRKVRYYLKTLLTDEVHGGRLTKRRVVTAILGFETE